MNVRQLILVAGAIAFIAGLIFLLVPVSVSGPDGDKIGCGNAIAADTSEAQGKTVEIPVIGELGKDYVAECESAVSGRRSWSIPLAVVGVLVAAGALLIRGGGRTTAVR